MKPAPLRGSSNEVFDTLHAQDPAIRHSESHTGLRRAKEALESDACSGQILTNFPTKSGKESCGLPGLQLLFFRHSQKILEIYTSPHP